MLAKTFDRQTAKFLAVVGENMPELPNDAMQGWIQDPRGLQKFLKGLCPDETVAEPKIIKIDRSQPFDLAKFLGKGRTIAEEDRRSLALTEVNLSKVQLVTTLREGETVVTGEERLRRLKEASCIRLDAKVFQTLWEDQALIPEEWKKKINGNTRYIRFEGTELRYRDGNRYVLSLYWNAGQWDWDDYWLEDECDVNAPSAVLALASN